MTATEFKEQFNLRYNNALGSAPGLDTFEISSFLTIAQEQIVKKYYDASKDPDTSFESKEKARRVLNELVVDEKITDQIESTRGFVPESVFYELSVDAMYFVLESVTSNNKMIDIIPVTHDNFLKSYRNPYRKPNKNKAWRIDISKESSKTTVEIITTEVLTRYNVRYISFPKPIIVEDLTSANDVGGLGLTINGLTGQSTCILADLVHDEIIDRAVELAEFDYMKGNTQGRVSLNSRI